MLTLVTLKKKPFENYVGKGENAGNQHFLYFPPCFQPIPKEFVFKLHLFCCLQNAFNLDRSKNLSFGEELLTFKNGVFESIAAEKKILVTCIFSFSHNNFYQHSIKY